MFTWTRYQGYEVSSKGDRRFSAFYARLKDGRTVEEAYQLDVKGYRIFGNNVMLGKGKPPLNDLTKDDLYHRYLCLWAEWADENLPLLFELKQAAQKCGNRLSDRFASSEINQARALADLLNLLEL